MQRREAFQLIGSGLMMSMALALTLLIGQAITSNQESGQARWQTDVENGHLQINLPAQQRLLAKWCQRDAAFIQSALGEEALAYCPGSQWTRLKARFASRPAVAPLDSPPSQWVG